MLWLSLALNYLALTALCVSQLRHHKALLHAVPSRVRQQVLRGLACAVLVLALYGCVQVRGLEIGLVLWLCQLLLAGMGLVVLLAWRGTWVLPLAVALPLLSGLLLV